VIFAVENMLCGLAPDRRSPPDWNVANGDYRHTTLDPRMPHPDRRAPADKLGDRLARPPADGSGSARDSTSSRPRQPRARPCWALVWLTSGTVVIEISTRRALLPRSVSWTSKLLRPTAPEPNAGELNSAEIAVTLRSGATRVVR
jgi:hypothetical protein